MNVLVLGGSQFVGRHIVEALCNAGHAVTVFNRGQSPAALPAAVERLRGDRETGAQGLAALGDRSWEACVDVSGFTARHLRASTARLHGRVGHYVYISAVSVYGDPAHGPVDESTPRSPPAAEDVVEVDGLTYGPLKVTCENIVRETFGSRSTLVRPQVVAGPHDPFGRFSYWVRRALQGGAMLAPGDGNDALQVVDARDVAAFVRRACEAALAGAFNLAGHRVAWRTFIDALGARDVTWVPADVIAQQGLTEFELPLYRRAGGRRSSLMHVSNDRARAAGFTLSSLEATIDVVRRWLPQSTLAPALSAERERAAIARAAYARNLK
jgi:2'-hydroxyisoflavone reductase